MNWLKTTWGMIATAAAAAFAFFLVQSANRHKKDAEKWRDRAIGGENDTVTTNTETAKAALSQAKLHEAKARERKEQARKKIDDIAKKDESMASIVSGWRSNRIH